MHQCLSAKDGVAASCKFIAGAKITVPCKYQIIHLPTLQLFVERNCIRQVIKQTPVSNN